MKLSALALPAEAEIRGDADVEITGASQDSRAVSAGDLYAGLPGARFHGAAFAAGALEAGAAAVLTDAAGWERLSADGGLPEGRAAILVEDPRGVLGAVSAQIFGTADGGLELLGITGTNGKTTTAFILDALLVALGRTTGLIGTVVTRIAGVDQKSVRTTPEAPDLHRLFARMRESGAQTCTMEVSSHALAQHRVDGAVFDVAGFTNLSQDHLDFHPTMEDYFAAKAELFTPARARRGVVVLDGEWGRRFAAASQIPTTTLSDDPADSPDALIERGEVGAFALALPDGSRISARSPLPGDFNVLNTALALTMLWASGVSAADLAEAVSGLEVAVPGRMELVSESAPRAVVDYCHTPDALEKALAGLRAEATGPLAVVVGAGGDRDPAKRPLMGRAAAEGADVVIVTDDNPRSEDPAAIRAAVLAGAREAIAAAGARAAEDSLLEIGSRAEAIVEGVARAGESGTLLVAGKGHETGQETAGVVVEFDDRERTREAAACARAAAQTGRVQD